MGLPDASGIAVVALGSNLGDSRALLTAAAGALQQSAAGGFRISSYYETVPVDCPPGSPRFLNAVALFRVRPGETPESLLDQLQAWEKQFGRRPKLVLNEPRPLDLDLIAFGEERRQTARLTLPHPRAHLRRFVLEPLAEIAPDYRLPGQQRTVSELLATLQAD